MNLDFSFQILSLLVIEFLSIFNFKLELFNFYPSFILI